MKETLAVLALWCSLPLSAQDDPRQRVRAARDLARQGSAAIPKLEPLATDQALEVRLEAIKSIVAIGTQHSLTPLVRALGDTDAEIQIRATDGLVNFYLPGYIHTGFSASLRRVGGAIKGRWSDTTDQAIDPYVEVRADVVAALGKLLRGPAGSDTRANAARALGVLRGRAGLGELLAAVRGKDDQIMYESVVAMEKIGDPKAAPGIAFLLRDPNEKIQLAALSAAGQLQNKELLPQLGEAFERARGNKVRAGALAAIAKLRDPASRPLFQRYFMDQDDGLRAAAAEGLARLKSAADTPLIEKAFNEERKMPVRLAQAFALVSAGQTAMTDTGALQYLVNTLNSRVWRGIAHPFLVELAVEAKVRQSLHAALARGTRDEKILLAQILARSGGQDSVGPLEQLTRDTDTEVVQESVRALRTLKARLP